VDIRVGDDYFAKGGWQLEPSKKPDVFSIGSKWVYKTKRVSFITDIDSISFDAAPGNKYNFIILLNQHTPCYIQVKALSNPVFLDKEVLVPLLAGFALILFLLYLFRQKIDSKKFLYLGYIATLLFWVMTFVSGTINGHYNHFKNTISELGAIESKAEIFTSSSLVLLSLLCIFFSIGFYKASRIFRISVWPAVLSLGMPASLLWAGIFPLGNEFHSLSGPLPLLVTIGSLLSFILWNNHKEFSALRYLSLSSFFIMMLLLLRFLQPFSHQYEGLVQRFFYLGWTTWYIAIAYHCRKKLNPQKL
jgi:hypothetical membrane protein